MDNLQKIIEDGNKRIDQSVERVIDKHCGYIIEGKPVLREGVDQTNYLLERVLFELERTNRQR